MQMLEKSMRLWFHTFWGSRVRQAGRQRDGAIFNSVHDTYKHPASHAWIRTAFWA
jgi:hypothetical protein